MSKYTTELRNLFDSEYSLFTREEVESWFSSYNLFDYLTQNQIDTIKENGLFSKEKLAKKIIDHYYMREIGFETPMLFKHYAITYMNEIMEEYLPLIYSACIKFDPLVNVDYTESFERNANNKSNVNNSGTSSSSSANSSSGLIINSDTPQKQINKTDILAGKYASSTSANENSASISDTTNTSSDSLSNSDTKEDYVKKIKGNSGVSATAQALIKQYRDIVKPYEKEIIEKLNVLFMGLY